MLRVIHGNRVEGLLAALIDGLPPADPFAPATIVVGSHLVQRWLTRELAFARGIAAGLELVTFDRFVERAWADPAAGLVALDKAQLAAVLASVLADAEVLGSDHPSMEGPNARVRVVGVPALRAFADWCTAGASHHAALLPGHHAATLTTAANFLGVESVTVSL